VSSASRTRSHLPQPRPPLSMRAPRHYRCLPPKHAGFRHAMVRPRRRLQPPPPGRTQHSAGTASCTSKSVTYMTKQFLATPSSSGACPGSLTSSASVLTAVVVACVASPPAPSAAGGALLLASAARPASAAPANSALPAEHVWLLQSTPCTAAPPCAERPCASGSSTTTVLLIADTFTMPLAGNAGETFNGKVFKRPDPGKRGRAAQQGLCQPMALHADRQPALLYHQ